MVIPAASAICLFVVASKPFAAKYSLAQSTIRPRVAAESASAGRPSFGRTAGDFAMREGYYRVPMTDSPEVAVALPWWRSPLNIALCAVALVVAGFALGTFVPRGDDPTVHNSVDTGFLQDMRLHHEQAVTMAIVYRSIAATGSQLDPDLQTIALEIHMEQGMETGRFVQLLRLFGEAESNESEQVMSWMGHSMPMDSMPGMATDEQLAELRDSRGPDADRLFAALMVAHHEGGVEMARYAVDHARNPEVIALARGMIKVQSGEINELRRIAGL